MRVPSPDGHKPCGSSPTGMVATSCGVLVVVYTFTTFSPPTVTYANWPFMFRTILTWFVIGPVSRIAQTLKGGRALNSSVLPVSFNVNHTCCPSGVAEILGQKGDGWGTVSTMSLLLTSTTTVSVTKLQHA